MAFELGHTRLLRTTLLSAVVLVGCAVHGTDDADEPAVLRHEGHGAAAPPTAKPTAGADAGTARDARPSAAPADCASTYDAIQATIFDSPTYGCSSAACHGTAGGHVDLRKRFSYDSLLGVAHGHEHDASAEHADAGHVHQVALPEPTVTYHGDGDEAGEEGAHGSMAHVVAGQPEQSMLYDNLRAKLQNTPTKLGGTPMPLVGPPVTKEQLEAVRLWIAAGAPEQGFVAGTQEVCARGADAGN